MKTATVRALRTLDPDLLQPLPSGQKRRAADQAPAAGRVGKRRTAYALLGVCLLVGGSSAGAGCGGDYRCALGVSEAAGTWVAHAPQSGREPANLRSGEQCSGTSLNVVAASADERGKVCSAASDALRLLGRCGISLRRPLDVEISAEVRHPLSRNHIFGFFDTRREQVLITRETENSIVGRGHSLCRNPPA